MNYKKLFIGFSCCFLIIGIIFYISFDTIPTKDLNIVAVNDITCRLEENWNGDFTGVISLARHYGMDIVILDMRDKLLAQSRKGLNRSLNKAIVNRDTIIDIHRGSRIIGKLIICNPWRQQITALTQKFLIAMVVCFIILIIFAVGYTLYLDKRILKPFQKLRNFAENIATGNLDAPLAMDRNNVFGAFTESFDIMREELKSAREHEKIANNSKKELVASLSHDIKTPLATIKSLSELLAIQVDNKKQKEKLEVIENKTNQIQLLTDNLFHSTLEDLEVLKVDPSEEVSTILIEYINNADYKHRISSINIPECIVHCDKLRISQIFDNIIANSYKYADTAIIIDGEIADGYLEIKIRDFGAGVNKDELPLITQKFYRGGNATGKSGSGIGLYMSKYFIEHMEGLLSVRNIEDGFVVEIYIKLA